MTTCDSCEDEIALTDVAGHYDGKCARCRKHKKLEEEVRAEERARGLSDDDVIDMNPINEQGFRDPY